MPLIDSHCHLDFEEYGPDRQEVIGRAKAGGLVHALAIGLWKKPGDFGNARELHRADPSFFSATIGIHPHDVAKVPEEDFRFCERAAAEPDIVAVGETGLDYHYDHSPREAQRQGFRRQIQLAKRVGKPVVVHVREADDDCLGILREERAGEGAGGVIHCFTGNWERAKGYLDLGMYISIAGVVTFKTAEDLREAVREIPLDRLLVETDSPFLSPVPFRGKRNEPAMVAEVAKKVSELKGVGVEEVGEATTANARALFRIGPRT